MRRAIIVLWLVLTITASAQPYFLFLRRIAYPSEAWAVVSAQAAENVYGVAWYQVDLDATLADTHGFANLGTDTLDLRGGAFLCLNRGYYYDVASSGAVELRTNAAAVAWGKDRITGKRVPTLSAGFVDAAATVPVSSWFRPTTAGGTYADLGYANEQTALRMPPEYAVVATWTNALTLAAGWNYPASWGDTELLDNSNMYDPGVGDLKPSVTGRWCVGVSVTLAKHQSTRNYNRVQIKDTASDARICWAGDNLNSGELDETLTAFGLVSITNAPLQALHWEWLCYPYAGTHQQAASRAYNTTWAVRLPDAAAAFCSYERIYGATGGTWYEFACTNGYDNLCNFDTHTGSSGVWYTVAASGHYLLLGSLYGYAIKDLYVEFNLRHAAAGQTNTVAYGREYGPVGTGAVGYWVIPTCYTVRYLAAGDRVQIYGRHRDTATARDMIGTLALCQLTGY